MNKSIPVADAPILARSLSLLDVIVYGLLYFVPIAPVSVFGALHNAANGMTALTYLLAAITMIFSAISYSEMAKRIPLSGSVYSYVSSGTNPFFGFLAGWALLLDYLLLPALLAILGAAALEPLFPNIQKPVWLLIFVFVPFVVNLFGITVNVKFGKILLIIQLLVLSVFFYFAIGKIFAQGVSADALLAPLFNRKLFSITAVFGAIPIAALSFIGFDAVSTLNEETAGGGETVSRATLLLLVIVTLLFVGQVYVASVFVPVNSRFDANSVDTAFYTVSSGIVGHWFLPVITLTNALIALLANALISQATTAKVIFCMARDKQLPHRLAKLNKRGAPSAALLLVAIVSIVISLLTMNKIEVVVTIVTFGALCAYVMLHVAVLIYFRRDGNKSIFLHVISPILGAATLSYALFNANPHAQVLGLIWLGIGLAVALFIRKRGISNISM